MADERVWALPTGSETIPPPPWRSKPGEVRRQEPLSREGIVVTSLKLLDEIGLDGLSMRRVAERLDTSPSSLYAHIRNKEELLELLFDRVLGELELPEPDPARWEEQLKEFMRQGRRLMLEHRDIARISIGRIPAGPNAVRWVEWLLQLFRRAGFPREVSAYAGDLLGLYVGSFAFEESLGLASPTGEDIPPEETVGMVRDYFASLPPDQFPNVTSMVDVLMSGNSDDRFEFGMDIFVAGLASAAGHYVHRNEG